MLVISRKIDETISIGNAKVKIVDIRGKRVLIGVDAPKDVSVHRKETEREVHLTSGKQTPRDQSDG